MAYIKPIHKNSINTIASMILMEELYPTTRKDWVNTWTSTSLGQLVTLVFNLENYIFRYNHQLGKEPTPTKNLMIMNIRLGIYYTIT
jgi:hypothetical protein